MKHEETLKIVHKILKLEDLKEGGRFKVSIKIPYYYGWIERLKIYFSSFNHQKEYELRHLKNENGYAIFETEVDLKTQAIYHYYFSFRGNGKFQYYKKTNLTGNAIPTKEECWKLSVGFEVPEWAKGAIMYHIFVDRYRKGSNTKLELLPRRTIHETWNESPVIGPDENGNWNIDFFGGNLKGISETIEYIKKLGVSIIYLSPIVTSQSNHRYDTADYEEVDPYAGSNTYLKELCEVAHRKGIKVILDAVFNHTGNDSKYFNQYGTFNTIGAYQSNQSPYYSFYKKTYNHGKEDFAYWWGMKNLPVCDGNSPKWKEYIFGEGGIIDKWFSLGIDGLRLDVADELTDEFIEGINKAVKRNKSDGFILGEVWKNPMRMGRNYISSGKSMHSVMNYLLVDALIRYYKYNDVYKLNATINEILTEYPKDTIDSLMNFTSTHDISRVIEIFGCDEFNRNGEWAWNLLNEHYSWAKEHYLSKEQLKHGKIMLKSYVFALAFLPGILSVFYGDEVGLEGIGNLANRATYPWNNRDKDLLKFFRMIGRVRVKNKFLKTAELRIINIDSEKFVFERYDENSTILVVVSRVSNEIQIKLPDQYMNAKIVANLKGCDKHHLSPYGAIAIKK